MKAPAIAMRSALALAVALAPLAAAAETGTTASYDLMTRETDAITAGELDGRMRLNVAPDGIVWGTFTDSEGLVSPVTGGLTGTKIWVQIGNGSVIGRGYFTGTLVDGKLAAQAPTTSLHSWTLEGTPVSH